MTLHAVDLAVFGLFLVWLFLNTRVILESIRITRIARRQSPPIPGARLREWTKRGDAPPPTDPELRAAIVAMARWRGLARRFFFVAIAAVLALVALQWMD